MAAEASHALKILTAIRGTAWACSLRLNRRARRGKNCYIWGKWRPTQANHREARDEEPIKTNAVCSRPRHGAAHGRRPRATTGGETWHAELPNLLRSKGAGGIRARRRNDPFLLVPGRAPRVRGRPAAGSQLRHCLLGHCDGSAGQLTGRTATARTSGHRLG